MNILKSIDKEARLPALFCTFSNISSGKGSSTKSSNSNRCSSSNSSVATDVQSQQPHSKCSSRPSSNNDRLKRRGYFLKLLSPLKILSMEKTIVTKVVSELKYVSSLEIFPRTRLRSYPVLVFPIIPIQV